jgi:hypothetical protein
VREHHPKPAENEAHGQDLPGSSLQLMLEATHAQHRAIVELQGLFARKGGELSPHFLTVEDHFEEIFFNSDEGVKSFAVLNFSPVTAYVGVGGATATQGNGYPIPPLSFLQLPIFTNEVKIAIPTKELEGLGAGASAMLAFIRYRHLVNLTAGPLSNLTGGTAARVTTNSPRSVAVTKASTLVLPANPYRRGLSIINTGEAAASLGLGQAAVVGDDIVLQPAGSWDGRIADSLWLGSIEVIAAANGSLAVVEI